MKTRKLLSLVLLLALTPFAMAKSRPAHARLMHKGTTQDDVYIISYKARTILYKGSLKDLNRMKIGMSKLESVYFYEPKIFKEAMRLYNGRKYAEAKVKFAECRDAFKSVDQMPNNYSSLAGFYVLECCRRMLDLDALAQEQGKLIKKTLTRQSQLDQLEVNDLWEAVRAKSWERLNRLAKSWENRKVTGAQRAQISYCHGLALEQLAKKNPELITKALNAYNRVLSADFTASTELVIPAANNALRVYYSDPQVQRAMKVWGSEDENKNSAGRQRLLEANSLVKLYKQAGFEAVKPLSADYKKFLKYEDDDKD